MNDDLRCCMYCRYGDIGDTIEEAAVNDAFGQRVCRLSGRTMFIYDSCKNFEVFKEGGDMIACEDH